MKRSLTTHIFAAIGLVVLSLLLTLIISFIRYKELLQGNSYQISVMVVSSLIFFIIGFFIGLRVEKRAFFHALTFGTLYLVIAFLFNFLGLEKVEMASIINHFTRFFILIIASVIARNMKV